MKNDLESVRFLSVGSVQDIKLDETNPQSMAPITKLQWYTAYHLRHNHEVWLNRWMDALRLGHPVEADMILPDEWIIIEWYHSKNPRHRARKNGVLKTIPVRKDKAKTKFYIEDLGVLVLWIDQAYWDINVKGLDEQCCQWIDKIIYQLKHAVDNQRPAYNEIRVNNLSFKYSFLNEELHGHPLEKLLFHGIRRTGRKNEYIDTPWIRFDWREELECYPEKFGKQSHDERLVLPELTMGKRRSW